jgi:hypothetical protein
MILGFHPIDIYCAQPSKMAQHIYKILETIFSTTIKFEKENMFGQRQKKKILI